MSDSEHSAIRDLHSNIADFLEEIRQLFREEAKPRLTLFVRNTGMDDANVLMTDDDIETAIAGIRKEIDRPTTPPPGGMSPTTQGDSE